MANGSCGAVAGVGFRAAVICFLGLVLATGRAEAKQQSAVVAQQPAAVSTTDASREELANLDRFLDNHPILEQELGSNPSLVNDPEYVQREPDLQIFLSHHPAVKAELQKDPDYLARRRTLADANTPGRGMTNGSPSLDGAEAAQLHEFLGAHNDVEQSLKQNPALINDSTFLGAHPELQTFLNQHPRARYLFVEDPRSFILPGDESAPAPSARVSASHSERSVAKPLETSPPVTRPAGRKPMATNATPTKTTVTKTTATKAIIPSGPEFDFGVSGDEVARMDQFLEDHAKIARDLTKDPLLVANHKYLDHHKDLRRFFDEHVRVREAFAEDPRYFVPGNGFGASPPPLEIKKAQELSNRDLAETEAFLRKHKGVAKKMRSNPLVAQDVSFLHHHGDLREFFDTHPHIQTELEEHPRYFMQREEEFHQNENLEVPSEKK
jgi:hypothetical protein